MASAVETSEPRAAEDSSETTDEDDTQPPQATVRVEQTDANDAALLRARPGEGAPVDDSRPDAETGTGNGSTSDAMAAAPGDESVGEAVTEAGGAVDSHPEIVVLVPDSADSADSADAADAAEGDTTARPSDVAEEAAQAPRPAPLPGSDVLAIELAAESWVEIYDRGGGRLFYSLAREGSEIVVQGAGPMRVLLGDVEGAVVAYNGEPYDLSRYQGRSVVHFTIGEPSSTTEPEPPAPAAEPLTRETAADEPGPSVADASDALSTPGQEPAMPDSAPTAEPLPENALPAPSAGDTAGVGFHDTQPDS
jgi:hypothetical protein